MHILVTGASGFVGRHLVPALSAGGHTVQPLGSPGEGCPSCVSVDLSDPQATRTIDFTGVDAVVHLAGLAAVGTSFREPARYFSQNPGMEANLFEALAGQGVRPRVVVISSGAVYATGSSRLTEASEIGPTSPYGVSKVMQEQVAAYYATCGFEVIVARPFNHIGPGQGLGYLVPDLANQLVALEAQGGGDVAVGDLRSSRDYTDVRDIARAYVALVEAGTPGGTYNVCSGVSRTGDQILRMMLSELRGDFRFVTSDELLRPDDASVVSASSERLGRDVGWRPQVPVDTTIRDVIHDWRTRAPSAR